MKHLKTYEEEVSWDLNIGDYLLIQNSHHTIMYGKKNFMVKIKEDNITSYKAEIFLNGKEDETVIFPYNLLRKLTPSEIEQYEMEKETNKYNI